jgi:CO dehydrogenase maturation factor
MQELPAEYFLQKGDIRLRQVGKIETYGQGCDGPLEKVVRDFMVEGKAVNLIDMKAGIEHFGRRTPDRMDVILGVLDYTLESISIAKRMSEFCKIAGIQDFWLILNKVGSKEVESMVVNKLGDLERLVIGTVFFDHELVMAGLAGNAVCQSSAMANVESFVERLEQVVST